MKCQWSCTICQRPCPKHWDSSCWRNLESLCVPGVSSFVLMWQSWQTTASSATHHGIVTHPQQQVWQKRAAQNAKTCLCKLLELREIQLANRLEFHQCKSLGEWFLVFWRNILPSSSMSSSPRRQCNLARWKHYYSLKHQELLMWHNTASQEVWILRNAPVRTLNLTYVVFHTWVSTTLSPQATQKTLLAGHCTTCKTAWLNH